MFHGRLLWMLGLAALSGCSYGMSELTDQTVCDLTARVRDLEPIQPAKDFMPPAINGSQSGATSSRNRITAGQDSSAAQEGVRQTGLLQVNREPPPASHPLLIPEDLPGSDAERFPDLREMTDAEKKEYFNKLYARLDPVPEDFQPAPGPDGKPLTLSDLQRMGTAHSPNITRAAAAVQAARGAFVQSGAYPNPLVGYEGDTIGDAATAGFQGFFYDQIIKTGNKLKLQQAAATMDLLNAELALRRAQSDLSTQVRQNYFQVLVALETIKINKALVRFSDAIYYTQKELMEKAPLAAPYEPMQVRPLAYQARFNLEQARNQYQASWKQLAATLGLPGLPPTELAGRLDVPIPSFEYDKVLAQVLERHTDILMARNDYQKARYNLRLAQITPYPDIEVRLVVQKDFTAPPFQVVHSVQVGGPLPIWDQNRGNIMQAEGQLKQASEEEHVARSQLTSSLADAFNRYKSNRRQVEITLLQVKDQIRVYEGIYQRRHVVGDVTFSDVVTAQQTFAGYISNYVTALGLQWTAVVDVANLLQTDDLFQVGDMKAVLPVPDLNQVAPLPCAHPCAPLPDKKYLHGADGLWPATVVDPQGKSMPPAPADQQSRTTPQPSSSDIAPTARRPAPLRHSQGTSSWASDQAPAPQAEELQELPPAAPVGK
jgi:cobalt-zinc-cadmium efflux system outer membrane protein